MGQKVSPTGFRLQVNKNWRSRWFAGSREYTEYLRQDLKVRRFIDEKFRGRSAIASVEIERSPKLVTVTIHTGKAGVVIGRGGAGVAELKVAIEKIFGLETRINIEEVKKPELNGRLVAENIASQLERRMSFRRVVKSTAANTMRAGAKGIRIEIAGRLGGAEMSRREKEIQGSVPLHTLRADIDYAKATAFTAAGTIGVKVWIYKGEAAGE